MATRTSVKPSIINGRRVRATKVDSCGRPVYGEYGQLVSKGFISVAYSAVTNSTDAVTITNANNETIANVPEVDSLTGYGIEITMADVDPEFFTLLTGMPLVVDADGNSVGFDVDTKIDLSGTAFALEVWSGVAGSDDVCSDESAQGSYGYFISPLVTGGYLSDFTIQAGAISLVITGASTKDGNAWGKGPYNVQLNTPTGGGAKVPGPLVTPLSSTTPLRLFFTEVAPPESTIGQRPLLDPSVTALTSISASVTGKVATITPLPDPATDEGIWYDFGDGTWDYDDTGATTIAHTYAADGTYTIQASNNGTWVSTTVNVTA